MGGSPPAIEGLAYPPWLFAASPASSLRQKLLGAVTNSRRTAQRLTSLLSGAPLDAARMRFPAMDGILKRIAKDHEYDVVQIEYGAMAVYLPLLRRLWPGARIVVDELEVMSVALERKRAVEGSSNRLEWDLRRWRTFEEGFWGAADAVLAMSAEESQVIDRTAGKGKGRVVPNGVDVNFFRFQRRTGRTRKRLVSR